MNACCTVVMSFLSSHGWQHHCQTRQEGNQQSDCRIAWGWTGHHCGQWIGWFSGSQHQVLIRWVNLFDASIAHSVHSQRFGSPGGTLQGILRLRLMLYYDAIRMVECQNSWQVILLPISYWQAQLPGEVHNARYILCHASVFPFLWGQKRPHTEAVMWIGRYLAGTRDQGLIFNPFEHYVDANFLGNWDLKGDPMCRPDRLR